VRSKQSPGQAGSHAAAIDRETRDSEMGDAETAPEPEKSIVIGPEAAGFSIAQRVGRYGESASPHSRRSPTGQWRCRMRLPTDQNRDGNAVVRCKCQNFPCCSLSSGRTMYQRRPAGCAIKQALPVIEFSWKSPVLSMNPTSDFHVQLHREAECANEATQSDAASRHRSPLIAPGVAGVHATSLLTQQARRPIASPRTWVSPQPGNPGFKLGHHRCLASAPGS